MSHDHAGHMMNGTIDHASHGVHMAHMGMEHTSMNHEGMNHGSMDHASMNHGTMDHGRMDHDVGASTSDACSDMGSHGMSVGISRLSNTQCYANDIICFSRLR